MGKLTLVFEAENQNQLDQQVSEYAAARAGGLSPSSNGSSPVSAAQPVTGSSEPATAATPAKAKSAKAAPKKEEAPVAEAEETVDEDDPFGTSDTEAEVEEEGITREAVEAALSDVHKKVSVQEVKKILAAQGIKKVKDITDAQFAPVMAACQKALTKK